MTPEQEQIVRAVAANEFHPQQDAVRALLAEWEERGRELERLWCRNWWNWENARHRAEVERLKHEVEHLRLRLDAERLLKKEEKK